MICECICSENDIIENIGNWSCSRNSEIGDHHTQESSDLVFLHRLYMLSKVGGSKSKSTSKNSQNFWDFITKLIYNNDTITLFPYIL